MKSLQRKTSPAVAAEASELTAPPGWSELVARLTSDPRPFDTLSFDERRARVALLHGSLETYGSAAAELPSRRLEEIELEEARFVRASG